ncbi:class I SAM-dependent methyltransferase [Nostoc sp.]|uniref:class I SAM-dependent methyltransferase n=1 Tax=Nostoc sp. TaxID=1180 RepID=UPI002FF7E297
MKKLNFGCGHRFCSGWVNIDFNSEHPEVIAHNLLQPLPYPKDYFDVIYSSHVLEHFSQDTGEMLVKECYRVLKPQGILRIVVPDLERTCREYLRIIDSLENEEARKQYEWIIIELIDQLVRTEHGGLMKTYWRQVLENNNQSSINYVEARTGVKIKEEMVNNNTTSLLEKVFSINQNKLRNKFKYLYLDMVKKLIPQYVRKSMIDETSLGEKHKWMYDSYSMKTLFERVGFSDIKFLDAHTSDIPSFSDEVLDINADGTVYLPGSLYCEGIKPNK